MKFQLNYRLPCQSEPKASAKPRRAEARRASGTARRRLGKANMIMIFHFLFLRWCGFTSGPFVISGNDDYEWMKKDGYEIVEAI